MPYDAGNETFEGRKGQTYTVAEVHQDGDFDTYLLRAESGPLFAYPANAIVDVRAQQNEYEKSPGIVKAAWIFAWLGLLILAPFALLGLAFG